MDEAPIKEEKISTYNTKAIGLLLVLFIGGIVLGLILSTIFVTETNERIENLINDRQSLLTARGLRIRQELLQPMDVIDPVCDVGLAN